MPLLKGTAGWFAGVVNDGDSELFSACCRASERSNEVCCAARLCSYAGASGCLLYCAVCPLKNVAPTLWLAGFYSDDTDFQSHKIAFEVLCN